MTRTGLRLLLAVGGAAAALTTTQAQEITGSLWEAPKSGLVDNVTDSVPSTAPASTPDVTFTVAAGGVNFNSGALYTIGEFLNSDPGGATILTGAGELGNTINDCLIEFKGLVTVTSGMTFTVTHDDGLTLSIGGLSVVNEPGPTPPVTDTHTYTGPSGTLPFDLLYAEVDGAPAVLQTSLPLRPSTPDGGSTVALLGIGVSGLAFLRRKIQA